MTRRNQHVFVTDWMTFSNEDIHRLMAEPLNEPRLDFPAQVIAIGPTLRPTAMPEIFETLIYSTRRALFVTPPHIAHLTKGCRLPLIGSE